MRIAIAAEDKCKTRGVGLHPTMEKAVSRRIGNRIGFSAYIQALIAYDLSKDVLSDAILLRLNNGSVDGPSSLTGAGAVK